MSDWAPRKPTVSVGQMVRYTGTAGHGHGEYGKVVSIHPDVSFAHDGSMFYYVTVDRDAGRPEIPFVQPRGKFIAADYTLRVHG